MTLCRLVLYTKRTDITLTLHNVSYRHRGLKTDVSNTSRLKYVRHHYTRSHSITSFRSFLVSRLLRTHCWCSGLLLHLITHTSDRTPLDEGSAIYLNNTEGTKPRRYSKANQPHIPMGNGDYRNDVIKGKPKFWGKKTFPMPLCYP